MNTIQKFRKNNIMKWSWGLPQIGLQHRTGVTSNKGDYPICRRVSLPINISNNADGAILKKESNVAKKRVHHP